MLIHFSNNSGPGRRFVYEVGGGGDGGGSAGGRSGETGESKEAARKRQERIADLEDLDALGLLDKGQTEELVALRQAEAAARAAREKADQARAALARAEKAGKPTPAYKPGGMWESEKPERSEEPEIDDGMEVTQAGQDALESLREEIEDTIYYYRSDGSATWDGLVDVLAEAYGVPPDKLKAGGVSLKSSDRAISVAAIKALVADDTGQG